MQPTIMLIRAVSSWGEPDHIRGSITTPSWSVLATIEIDERPREESGMNERMNHYLDNQNNISGFSRAAQDPSTNEE